MKTYTEIINEIKKINAEIAEPENAPKYAPIETLKIKRAILYDNARRAYVAEMLPVLLEILNRYDGKPYGEKTKAKISDELKARKGCACYISREYGRDELHLVPLDDRGYSNRGAFDYNALNLTTARGGAVLLSPENKINGKITADELRLVNCPAYVENVDEYAAEIAEAFKAAAEAAEAAERAAKAYNDMIPSTGLRRFAGARSSIF